MKDLDKTVPPVSPVEKKLQSRWQRSVEASQQACEAMDAVQPFIGGSAAIRELAAHARRVLAVNSPVLILGETGTGKSLLARWLHQHGTRAAKPFVDLNCAGLTREFLETELFGHERGSFTGAVSTKEGLLDVAQQGTLFLDEIGDMPHEVQPKLLTVLEEKRYRRLGDVRDRFADVNLIAATNQDLNAQVKERRFRSDLYFRVSTLQLHVPALRDRLEDIAELAEALLRRLSRRLNRPEVRLAAGAVQALKSYDWPGNIRELINVLERTLLLTDSDVICQGDLRFDSPRSVAQPSHSGLSLQELERMHIERVLREEDGRVADAALRLGIPRSTLYQKIKTLHIAISEI